MATDFIMPRLADQQQQQHQQHQHHQQQQQQQQQQHAPQFYPQLSQQQQQQLSNFVNQPHASQVLQAQIQQQLNSANSSRQISPLSTSNNASPTSPKSYHGRQLRPLYIPAVLRPTDYPSKKTPTTKSNGDDDSLQASSSWTSLTGLGAFGRLTRRSTGDSGKCMDNDLNLDLFPKPTAQPTRGHWKPDFEASLCDEPSCMRRFNYWTRRHHCRKCGNVFCDTHSGYDIPLDQDANYNPRGTPSRSCSHCHTEFEVWCSRTNSQASSNDGSVHDSSTAPASPISASTPSKGKAEHKEVAASVPRDWNWSTF